MRFIVNTQVEIRNPRIIQNIYSMTLDKPVPKYRSWFLMCSGHSSPESSTASKPVEQIDLTSLLSLNKHNMKNQIVKLYKGFCRFLIVF